MQIKSISGLYLDSKYRSITITEAYDQSYSGEASSVSDPKGVTDLVVVNSSSHVIISVTSINLID